MVRAWSLGALAALTLACFTTEARAQVYVGPLGTSVGVPFPGNYPSLEAPVLINSWSGMYGPVNAFTGYYTAPNAFTTYYHPAPNAWSEPWPARALVPGQVRYPIARPGGLYRRR